MPIPLKTKQLSRSFMRDEVYSTLLQWIMEGILRPGEKLSDKDLAENLGVSRTPVREALKRLEDKALIEASANRWIRVAKISIDEAELIYPIIWTMEALAVSMAMPHITDQDLKRMHQANADLAKAIKACDAVKASQADARFHEMYIKKSGNHYLIDIIQDLKVKHRRLEVIYFEGCVCASDSVDEHNKILAALELKNVDRTVAGIRTNWISSLDRQRINSGSN